MVPLGHSDGPPGQRLEEGEAGSTRRPHLAERPREALGAVAAEAVDQVLAEADVAGAAGTSVQLALTVPAPEAPWAHAQVAVHQVLGGVGGAGG